MELMKSKTIIGLLIILILACIMAFLGKLDNQLVDVMKYVGTSFMAVRVIANGGESYVKGKQIE